MRTSQSSNFLQIGGVIPFTTIDFPIVSAACVVFCQGCPWRCSYCQNKDLQEFQKRASQTWAQTLKMLEERKGFLDGVVFSGGEPLAQKNLEEAILQVKALGFKVAIHTAGALPEHLERIIPLLDWVGFDIKAPFAQYVRITGVQGSGKLAEESLQILLNSKVAMECRTTVDPDLLAPDDILQIAMDLRERGIKTFALQSCFDENRKQKHSPCFDPQFLNSIRPMFNYLIVR